MRFWTVLMVLMFASSAVAEEINEKYSYKDFMQASLRHIKVEEFNNTVIVGSCFYREGEPNCKVFPDGIIGVTFRACNLDNVYIPPGNTIEDTCCHRNLVKQNDGEHWVLDAILKPLYPMNKEQRIAAGVSYDPKNIPAEQLTEEEKTLFEDSIYVVTEVSP